MSDKKKYKATASYKNAYGETVTVHAFGMSKEEAEKKLRDANQSADLHNLKFEEEELHPLFDQEWFDTELAEGAVVIPWNNEPHALAEHMLEHHGLNAGDSPRAIEMHNFLHEPFTQQHATHRHTGMSEQMQEGAVIEGPTEALIGESGPEMVVPLDNPDAAEEVLETAAEVTGVETNGETVEAVEDAAEAVEEAAEAVEESAEAVEEVAETVSDVIDTLERLADFAELEAVEDAAEAIEDAAEAVEDAEESEEIHSAENEDGGQRSEAPKEEEREAPRDIPPRRAHWSQRRLIGHK